MGEPADLFSSLYVFVPVPVILVLFQDHSSVGNRTLEFMIHTLLGLVPIGLTSNFGLL